MGNEEWPAKQFGDSSASADHKNDAFVENNKLKIKRPHCRKVRELSREEIFIFFSSNCCGDSWLSDTDCHRIWSFLKKDSRTRADIEEELRAGGSELTFPESMVEPSGRADAVTKFCRYVCKNNSWAKVRDCINTNCPLYNYRSRKAISSNDKKTGPR